MRAGGADGCPALTLTSNTACCCDMTSSDRGHVVHIKTVFPCWEIFPGLRLFSWYRVKD